MKLEEVTINAKVYVDHLEDAPPDISLECKTNLSLREREAHTTGILRTWVAGQVGRAIWIQVDSSARLVPYHLSELDLVKNCICASMGARKDVQYPQGWQCPYHGFVCKGTEHLGVYAEQERSGRLRQVEAAY